MAQIPVYVDDQLKRQVEAAAAAEDRSVSWLIRQWIEAGLQQQGRPTTRPARQPEKVEVHRQ